MPASETLERSRLGPERAWAFRDAVRPLLGDAFTLARYLLLDSVEAEDVVEDGYRRALPEFGSRDAQGLKPWWLAIVRQLCHARLVAPRQAVAVGSANRPGMPGDLIRELPTDLREAVVLRDVIDCSYAEISEVTGAPADAVLRRLAEGRTQLRHRLGKIHAVEQRPPPRRAAPAAEAPRRLCAALGAGRD
jgi:RNA polymerase sigma-70 factor (ECF subfamily)